ncbi:MAG: nicotinate-nucleotide adenylyltransferase [Rhodospirillaceae bacterium]|nr:nicotinate-nucleotide adenylyltransferase [Rhodospirillaceae bacterium]
MSRRHVHAEVSRLSGRRIGLLGGSFNPAHEGHLHISEAAIAQLRLDEVWWLVSPQNPLKPTEGMADLPTRLSGARAIARRPDIHVTDIEARLDTRYTADTVRALRRHCPGARFVWLMGADNLEQMPKWRNWTTIFEAAPVAVFARSTYSLRALAGKVAHRFGRYRVRERGFSQLAQRNAPAWAFLHIKLHPATATEIRKTRLKQP